MSGFQLLPPAPDACQTCARKHPPDQPHDAQSLYWATARAMQGLPPATWADAMKHCTEEVREIWTDALRARGVDINGSGRTDDESPQRKEPKMGDEERNEGAQAEASADESGAEAEATAPEPADTPVENEGAGDSADDAADEEASDADE